MRTIGRCMSDKQTEILLMLTPPPLGVGLTMTKVSQCLGITTRAGWKRIANFKKHCPKAYENWLGIVRSSRRFQKTITRPNQIGNDLEMFEKLGVIKEFFPDYIGE